MTFSAHKSLSVHTRIHEKKKLASFHHLHTFRDEEEGKERIRSLSNDMHEEKKASEELNQLAKDIHQKGGVRERGKGGKGGREGYSSP